MPSKPLRFLYRKYAGHAPQGSSSNGNGAGLHPQYKYGDLRASQPHSGSLGQLQHLGRELTEVERIQMFFALSDAGPGGKTCKSQTFSSVGSASTNGRSISSKKDQRSGGSPSRNRSKSQEFQSKYRLALSRSSPEHKNGVNSNTINNSQNTSSFTQLPIISQGAKNNSSASDKPAVNGITENGNNTQYQLRQEQRSAIPSIGTNIQLTATQGDSVKVRSKSAQSSAMPQTNLHIVLPKATLTSGSELKKEKFPRCQSRSTVDADRIDSSQYQYLLDDISSLSSSTSLCSIKSDPASTHFSARAQRPSTTATSRATQRLRDLHTCTTNGTPRSKSRHNSFNNKSPENQWPPRYAIIPSWPSYEDIQTLNSCGEHRNLLTQIYRRDGRKNRDRNHHHHHNNASNRVNIWNPRGSTAFQPIHVVPSHTTMECTMCNLYSHNADPTLCPPNSPMVIGLESQGQDDPARRSATSFSLLVNRSGTNLSGNTNPNASSSIKSRNHYNNNSIVNSSASGHINNTIPLPTTQSPTISSFAFQSKSDKKSEVGRWKSQHKNSSSIDAIQHGEPGKTSDVKHVAYHRPSKKDVSYSWDTCKFAYVKAKG